MNDPAFSLFCFLCSFAVVVSTSLWIAVDASVNKIPTGGVDYDTGAGGAVTWFIACLLMWIIVFPWYLIKKSSVLRIRSEQRAREAKREASQQGVQAATADLQERVRDLEASMRRMEHELASLHRLALNRQAITEVDLAKNQAVPEQGIRKLTD